MRGLLLLCLFSLVALASPSPRPASFSNSHLEELSNAIEKALNAWDLAQARRLMVQVEALNLQGLALLHYVRGRMALQQGLYDEAVDEFVLAGQEDKPGTFLRIANAGKRFLKTAQRFESDNFVLLVPQGKQEALAGYALEVLEAQHKAVRAELGFASPEKLRVEWVPSARELAGLSGVPFEKLLSSNSVAFCKFGKMVFLSPSALRGGFAWQDSLAHAYVYFAVARQTRNKTSTWTRKALAAYLESRWRLPLPPPLPKAPWAALQQRMRASPALLLETLRNAAEGNVEAHEAQLAVAEGFLWVEHLRNQQGPQALLRLLEKLAEHGELQRAISELSHMPWARWKQAFRNATLSRRFPLEAKPPPQEKDISNPALLRELRLARLYANSQRHQAAAFHYAKAWALGGQNLPSVAQGYVQVLLALSQFEEAEKVLEGSLLWEAAPAWVWISLGKLRLHQAQWAQAQTAFERALAQNPFLPELHVGLFFAAKAQGNTALARRAQEAAALLLETTPEAVVGMAP